MDASTLFTPWLETQCRMIGGTVRGMVWLQSADAGGELRPAACWPAGSADAGAWLALVNLSANPGSDAFVTPMVTSEKTSPHHLVACPLSFGGGVTGLVAIEVIQDDKTRLQSMLQLLQWGGAWLELLLKERGNKQDSDRALLLKVLAKMLGKPEQQDWLDCVAGEMHCTRVALAWCEHGRWRLQSLSGKQTLNPHSQAAQLLAAQIGAALETGDKPAANVCVITLKNTAGERVGGLFFERRKDQPFQSPERVWCAQLAAYAGPVLTLTHRARPGLVQRGFALATNMLHRLLGKGHFKYKFMAAVIVLMLLAAALVPVDYRVTAPASLEGVVQRAVAAPRDGYIASAPQRAGDAVHAGDILAVLDSRELELEADKWRNQRAQWRKAYREALSDHKRAQARIQQARIARADAELALVEAQLARNTLRAPIDGIVVSGDLSQSLDAPVSRGDVLFEVAPLDRYRVVLQVDDRDIAALQAGQAGELTLSGLPGRQLSFSVNRITPVAQVIGGRNRFRVEGERLEQAKRLRPGMAGTGKITTGKRSLLWILGHRTLDWLRLQSWVWWF